MTGTLLGSLAVGVLAAAPSVGAMVVTAPLLQRVSTDQVPNQSGAPTLQNTTHSGVDTFSAGSTIVSAFQVGRSSAGFGSGAVGWATSKDDGRTWTHGLLPGLTERSPSPNNAYPLVTDQTVGYDAKHAKWIVPTVAYTATGSTPAYKPTALQVSRSTSGTTWVTNATPVVSSNVDKSWGACDNTVASPNYGTCYIGFSRPSSGYGLAVVRSTDGGATWSAPVDVPAAGGGVAVGYNVFPVVQPNGNLVIVYTDVRNGRNGSKLKATRSLNGGVSFLAPKVFETIARHSIPQAVRARTKPTVDVDASGLISVIWSDCRFSTGCAANDLVRATSTDGVTWTAPTAPIPLDPPGAAPDDKFVPGLAIAPGTSGATARLSVVYYTFNDPTTHQFLSAEYTTSNDGGQTWSTPYNINSAPMDLSWFARTPSGSQQSAFFGDYSSVSYANGSAVTVAALAVGPSSSSTSGFQQYAYALALDPGFAPSPVRPKTTITSHPKKRTFIPRHHRKVKVTFTFTSDQVGATFKCKVDHKAWRKCNSGVRRYNVAKGKHVFKVRARHSGLRDRSPAKYKFIIKQRRHG